MSSVRHKNLVLINAFPSFSFQHALVLFLALLLRRHLAFFYFLSLTIFVYFCACFNGCLNELSFPLISSVLFSTKKIQRLNNSSTLFQRNFKNTLPTDKYHFAFYNRFMLPHFKEKKATSRLIDI
jgi:hypothetical protein